jgi:hypothetical protein
MPPKGYKKPQPEVKRKYTRRQGQTVVNGMVAEPAVPICHIERGSGGDIRYSIRCPGLTAASAREEAMRQFLQLRADIEALGGKA